jgi:hypothetical protein
MPLPNNVPPDIAFSLTCERCDAGMDIDSYDQALAQGWTGIDYDPDGLAWNFVGLCPDCRREEEERDRKRGLSQT